MRRDTSWAPITPSVSARRANFWCAVVTQQTASTIFARSQAALYATRHRIMTTVFATALADGLASLNQTDEALHTIDDAIVQIGAQGESFDMPEMLR